MSEKQTGFAASRPDLPPGAPNPNGAAMSALSQRVKSERQRLTVSGLLKPATIINFNPIELQVESALIAFRVPRYNQGKTIKVKFGNTLREASVLTVRDAIIRPMLRNVTKADDISEPVGEYDALSILPIEIVWCFQHEYFDGDNPMGGMLVFEGDVHTLSKIMTAKDEERAPEYRVPDFITLADRSRSYHSKTANFEDELARAISLQRTYCEAALDRAFQMFNDPDQRKNITNIDHVWAEFAQSMGWIQQKPEWVYATTREGDVCNNCGAVKKHPNAHACVCGIYYDPFTSFMAGRNVPPAQLVSLPKEQFEKVKKETAKRRALEAELAGVATEKTP